MIREKKWPSRRSNDIDRGKNINRLIRCSPNLHILIRDIEDIKTKEEIIDFRHILERKRINNKGFYVTEKQWPYFYKAVIEINERKNNR